MLFFILCCSMSCEKEIIGPPTVVVNVVNNSDSTIYYNAFHCNVEKEEDYKMISHMVNNVQKHYFSIQPKDSNEVCLFIDDLKDGGRIFIFLKQKTIESYSTSEIQTQNISDMRKIIRDTDFKNGMNEVRIEFPENTK